MPADETSVTVTMSPRRFLGSDAPVWLLAAGMAVVAAMLAGPHLLTVHHDWSPTPAWWALLPVFAAAEILVIHLPAARSSHSHSLREVPAVTGLTFLTSGQYVSAYVLGAGLALLLWSRQRGLKLTFNVAMFALEATLGSLTYGIVLGNADPTEPHGWAAAILAVLMTDLMSAAAVTAAISLTEGRFDDAVLREALKSGLPAAVINTCMALLVVILIVSRASALPLLGVVLLLLVVAYRAFVSLGTGYAKLQLLYRFVGSTGRSAELGDAVETLLAEAATLLRASRAVLIVLAVDGEHGTRSTYKAGAVSTTTLLDRPDPSDTWWLPAKSGKPVLRSHDANGRRGRATTPVTDASGPRDGIAVPLQMSDRVEAVLLVTDRTFEEQTFSHEDLLLFQALGAHAAVALDQARLVDRLRRLATQRAHEARHDSLTGLPNRRAFHAAVTETLQSGDGGAVLLLDLDDFKDVNDTLGHSAGDALLRVTGQRLQDAGDGIVARLGGDEFAVLLVGASITQALDHAHQLLRAIAASVPLHDITLTTTASIGLAPISRGHSDTDELLAHADVAMYTAKAASSGVEVYRPEDSGATHRRLVLAGDLPSALEHHGLEVWYQPQADARTRTVTGAEALLRWKHPTYGHVPPPEIIAIAERTGLLRRLTDAVLADALHQRAAWADAGYPIDISVNVTPRDLCDETLPDVVASLLVATGTPAAALTIEITESGVMSDPERCLAVLDALAELGVRLSVDDFGTGYSSLAYLERLPVHEVKIDRSFVQRLEHHDSDATVVRATVSLAHDLGLTVVAEGVEDDDTWERIADLGCELVQGYCLARPMPPAGMASWLSATAPVTVSAG